MRGLRALAGIALAAGAAVGVLMAGAPQARACGCFAPPDPTVPVVQAGERILFSMADGEVTAHIQVQYAGSDGEFGWIVPLPSVPTLELGTDELFVNLIQATQPTYRVDRIYEGNCWFPPVQPAPGPPGITASVNVRQRAGGDEAEASYQPLVYQDSVGPYDYAVLRADRRQEMLDWLQENRYFIPAGTDDAVAPYIRPGAYFLALKLRPGGEAGDVQPVVLKYRSDLPMIPIVLTAVAAQPDMGIQVWLLGEGRAIPRNYRHTVLNDSRIDWLGQGANYNDLIIAATREAPDRHTFVTEFAGRGPLVGVLDGQWRFGDLTELASQPDPVSFVTYLNRYGYVYTGQLLSILQRYLPVPEALAAEGVTPLDFYSTLEQRNPLGPEAWPVDYQPQLMAEQIDERVVQPARRAGALFRDAPFVTRLYTTLSPEDMTADPVFSFNRELPEVSNVHTATLTYHCGFRSEALGTTAATLVTERGFRIEMAAGTGETGQAGSGQLPDMTGPYSARIEALSEEGPPRVEVDNTGKIQSALPQAGCQVAEGSAGASGGGLLLVALALLGKRSRPPRPA